MIKVLKLKTWHHGLCSCEGGITLDANFELINEVSMAPEFIHTLISMYPETIILEGNDIYMVNKLSDSMARFYESFKD